MKTKATKKPVSKTARQMTKRTDKSIARKKDLVDLGFQGEFGRQEMKKPIVSIVQKTSKTHGDFSLGEIVVGGREGYSQINFIPMAAKKQYLKKIPYGSSEPQPVYDTEHEVVENNGTLDWDVAAEGKKDLYTPRAIVAIMVELPKGSLLTPDIELDKKPYKLCLFYAQSTSYAKFMGTMVNDVQDFYQDIGLRGIHYQMETREEDNGTYSWYTPALSITGDTSEKTRQTLDEMIHNLKL